MPATTPIAAPAGPSQPQAAGTPAAPPHPPADYIGRIQARLLAVKRYPAEARARGEEGTVLLRFVLAADGEVLSARVIRSSGVTSLDTEGLAMIARAAPFPPLPDELRATPLALAVPVTFSLRSR
ncbi:Energy transducer TonB [Rhodovastum atsumiense]|uniref:Energy transducer TonB n=2 Tax=Rhodovastum atsumiense TaxID=504468 RepID=A0A5M6J0N6_9PROT|nr:energy transducer TonB [Rhodovastum atsumiense]KAA5614071.1 energy transducer TonB [Rhodovastum atsumiense]CAH2598889.1 Energy transducer TonB [Rhodovastum atsumiense]